MARVLLLPNMSEVVRWFGSVGPAISSRLVLSSVLRFSHDRFERGA